MIIKLYILYGIVFLLSTVLLCTFFCGSSFSVVVVVNDFLVVLLLSAARVDLDDVLSPLGGAAACQPLPRLGLLLELVEPVHCAP